jgi:hypothetical protein
MIEVMVAGGKIQHEDGETFVINDSGCLLIRGATPDTHDSRPPTVAVYAPGQWIRAATTVGERVAV